MKIETHTRNGVTTIVVAGDVDAPEKTAVGNAVRALLARGESRIVFDFQGVTFLGSSGVSCLVSARRDALAKKGGVALVNPPPMIRKVLHTLGFAKDFPAFPTREEAEKSLGG